MINHFGIAAGECSNFYSGHNFDMRFFLKIFMLTDDTLELWFSSQSY